MNNILYYISIKRGDLKQSQPKLMASPPALVWGAVFTLGLELPRAPVNTSSLLVEPDLYPPPLLPPVCLDGREGALLALLLRNLCTLLLRHVLAVGVGHLHQFLLLNILTAVICVLLAGAWNLNPLLASVPVLLPTRLTICLLLATALCLCVRLRLLTVLLGAHLFVDSLTGVLVDSLTGLSELLNLLLVTLLLYLLDVLCVPDRLLCGDARDPH